MVPAPGRCWAAAGGAGARRPWLAVAVDVVAVDWSGRRHGAQRHIWLARAVAGELLELRGGFSRPQLVDELVRQAQQARGGLVVGLDFSFSLPAWFVRRLGAASAEQLWRTVASSGERWLTECP